MSFEVCIENIDELIVKAIKNNDIKVFYQPKYDAVNGRLVGAEALARWITPGGDFISPALFVPMLEQTGLVVDLDWYMLDKTCRFLRQEIDSGRKVVTVSVNFSRIHTKEPDTVNRICEIVDGYGLSHKYIEIEITESALTYSGETVIEFVKNVRGSGFDAAIDDFGSGLSSLNFVKDVPANVLKIDRSLLSGNCENEKERIVLESIFDFAHRLKLKTVAEGVETKEQLGFLRTCGCDIIQGFLFAKPMPEEDFKKLLECSDNVSDSEDILVTQSHASATQLLLDAVFMRFPLIIISNLTKNSFYMMVYENFSTKSCPSTGVYTDLVRHGASTMHPDDRKLFADTFDLQDQISGIKNGQTTRTVITRQLGDDGIYRRVETTNYYVNNPSSEDLLAITLSRTLE